MSNGNIDLTYQAQSGKLYAEQQNAANIPGNVYNDLETARTEITHLKQQRDFRDASINSLTAELERTREQLRRAVARESELQANLAKVRAQLPAEMQNCTIVFEECEAGHSHLRGTNWLKHPCALCENKRLRDQLVLSSPSVQEGELTKLQTQLTNSRSEALGLARVVSEYRELVLELVGRGG